MYVALKVIFCIAILIIIFVITIIFIIIIVLLLVEENFSESEKIEDAFNFLCL